VRDIQLKCNRQPYAYFILPTAQLTKDFAFVVKPFLFPTTGYPKWFRSTFTSFKTVLFYFYPRFPCFFSWLKVFLL